MKYKFKSLVLVTMSILSFFGANAQVESRAYSVTLYTLLSHTVDEISVEELTEELKKQDIILLDAREKNEFAVSHLQGATYVGYDNFDLSTVKNISKDQKVVVYCSVGYRSEKVAEKLKKDGFTDVSNLYGGIFEWVNQKQTVYNGTDSTKKIHAFDKIWGIWLNEGEKVY